MQGIGSVPQPGLGVPLAFVFRQYLVIKRQKLARDCGVTTSSEFIGNIFSLIWVRCPILCFLYQ